MQVLNAQQSRFVINFYHFFVARTLEIELLKLLEYHVHKKMKFNRIVLQKMFQ